MLIRRLIPFLLLLSSFSINPNANAMYKGDDAFGNPLVVATGRGCSGTLVSERIVVLAAHCAFEEGLSGIFEPGGKQTIDPSYRKCGDTCGGFNVHGDFAKAIFRIIPEGNYQEDRSLDIAIWILDRDVPVNPKLRIATKEDVTRFISNNSIAVEYGYGQTGSKDFPERPSSGKLKFSPEGTIMEGVKLLSSKGYSQFTAVGPWTPCGGDSGGPIYVEENGFQYYVGNVVSSSIVGCFSEVTSAALVVMNMLYMHMDLLDRANVIVTQQLAEEKSAAELKAKQEAEAKPSAELKAKQEAEAKAAAELKAKQESETRAAALKKKTITCLMGKLIKKVTAIKPVCPTGFKKK